MTDSIIQKALDQIAANEADQQRIGAEVARLKIFVNEADRLSGATPRFDDIAIEGAAAAPMSPAVPIGPRWKPGEFFNKPFSAAVRQVFVTQRGISNDPTPMTVDEIHAALTQGSFDFGTNGSDAQKNSIRISLGKNSAMFVKLPNSDLFALVDWYGGKKERKKKAVGVILEDDDDDDDAASKSEEEQIADSNVTELKTSAA